VNIGNTDITDGNLRIILGLIWTLILRYDVNKGAGGDDRGGKNDLLRWVQSKIPEYNIQNFSKDWNDGRALCGLTNAIAPGSFTNHSSLNPSDKVNNCQKGIDTAYDALNIPKLLEAEDLSNPRVDEQSVMTYITQFRNAEAQGLGGGDPNARAAAKCQAYGPGLVQAVAREPANFQVDTPDQTGRLQIRVEGPDDDAPVRVNKTNNPDGTASYQVTYTPTTPGEYKVHITYNGVHIPGSVFTVHVLKAISLGGEGKIRVFYSTTSSSEKGRHDVIQLQRLLEAKKVHQRPDFEPWIPVDVMDKPDREAVFQKAGTRQLPIVFVDDEYIGDYDTCNDLEERGQLNEILKYNVRRK